MTDQQKPNWIEKLKTRWDLKSNFELSFVFVLLLATLIIAYIFSLPLVVKMGLGGNVILATITRVLFSLLAVLIIHFTLTRSEKLKSRWKLKSNFQLLIILILFSITGSMSIKVARPILEFLNITNEMPGYFYWPLRILVVFPAYQILFLFFGTILGQWKFAWWFEKKMLSGLGRLVGIKPSKNQD